MAEFRVRKGDEDKKSLEPFSELLNFSQKVHFYYDLLNTPSARGGVNMRKRGLGGNYVSPRYRSDINPF